RRSTTYTPSTEHASAMTSAPYNASRKSRTVLNTRDRRYCGLTLRDDDAMTVERVHLHGDAVHLGQRLLGHDLVGRADTESAFDHECDPRDIVGDLVERMAHHED